MLSNPVPVDTVDGIRHHIRSLKTADVAQVDAATLLKCCLLTNELVGDEKNECGFILTRSPDVWRVSCGQDRFKERFSVCSEVLLNFSVSLY